MGCPARAALGAGGGCPGIRGPAHTKNAQSASGDFSDFRAVRQPACLLTCGFLWNRGPWVWGVGPHSNSPLRFIFGALFINQKRSLFWKWVFLAAEPRNRPKRAPQQAQGTGHICGEQNAPKISPKLPGVGFRHALACLAQRVHAARLRLSLIKVMEQRGGEMMYSQ